MMLFCSTTRVSSLLHENLFIRPTDEGLAIQRHRGDTGYEHAAAAAENGRFTVRFCGRLKYCYADQRGFSLATVWHLNHTVTTA